MAKAAQMVMAKTGVGKATAATKLSHQPNKTHGGRNKIVFIFIISVSWRQHKTYTHTLGERR